jgi:hypothetical protein
MKKSFYIILIFAVNVFFIGMIVIQSIYIKNMVEMRHLILVVKSMMLWLKPCNLLMKIMILIRKNAISRIP